MEIAEYTPKRVLRIRLNYVDGDVVWTTQRPNSFDAAQISVLSMGVVLERERTDAEQIFNGLPPHQIIAVEVDIIRDKRFMKERGDEGARNNCSGRSLKYFDVSVAQAELGKQVADVRLEKEGDEIEMEAACLTKPDPVSDRKISQETK
jgi:hypothetical protein